MFSVFSCAKDDRNEGQQNWQAMQSGTHSAFLLQNPCWFFRKIACWGISPIPIEQLRGRSWLRVSAKRFDAGKAR